MHYKLAKTTKLPDITVAAQLPGDSDTVQVPLRTWGAQMVHLHFSFGVFI